MCRLLVSLLYFRFMTAALTDDVTVAVSTGAVLCPMIIHTFLDDESLN